MHGATIKIVFHSFFKVVHRSSKSRERTFDLPKLVTRLRSWQYKLNDICI